MLLTLMRNARLHSPASAPESLRTRLLTAFALLSIAPLVLGAVISLVFSVNLAQDAVTQDQQRTAQSMGELIADRWRALLDDMQSTATFLERAGPGERAALLDALRLRCGSCDAVVLIDQFDRPQGVVAAGSTNPCLAAATLTTLRRGAEIVSAPTASPDAASALCLGVPQRTSAQSGAMLVATLDVQRFGSPLLAMVHPSNEAYSYVVNAAGQLIIAPQGASGKLGQDIQTIPLVAAALAGKRWEPPESYAYLGLLLPRVDGAWYRVAEPEWYVLVEAPLIISTAHNWYLFLIQSVLLGLTAVGALVVARRLATTITRPVEQLQQGVARLQSGEWEQPLRVRRLDEIGQLGVAFNQMAQELLAKQGALVTRTEELALLNVELRRALEEARAAAALKSQFVATISHELRTPLTGIIGYADMVEMGVYGPMDEQLAEPIGRIAHSGRNLLQIINDLLDFSRLEAGKLDLHEEPFALSDLLVQIRGTCAPLAQAKGLVLHDDIDARPLPMVWGDATRLRQVVLNLLSNAIKFTERGAVTLSAQARPAMSLDKIAASLAAGHFGLPVTGRHHSIEDWLVISVRDTGCGIAHEDQQLIFEEFRQVDGGYNRLAGGTGLGLAIAKRLVALMSGVIHVTSDLGSGSTFTVILPLKGVDVAAALEQIQHER